MYKIEDVPETKYYSLLSLKVEKCNFIQVNAEHPESEQYLLASHSRTPDDPKMWKIDLEVIDPNTKEVVKVKGEGYLHLRTMGYVIATCPPKNAQQIREFAIIITPDGSDHELRFNLSFHTEALQERVLKMFEVLEDVAEGKYEPNHYSFGLQVK